MCIRVLESCSEVRAHTALLCVHVLKGDLKLPLLLVPQLLLSVERLEDLRRDDVHRLSATQKIGLLQTLQLREQPCTILQMHVTETHQSPHSNAHDCIMNQTTPIRALPACAALSAAHGFLSVALSPVAPACHKLPLAAAPPNAGSPALRPVERTAEKHHTKHTS